MAPVLSFTAEEAFKVFSPNESETIFTERFEPLPEVAGAEALSPSGTPSAWYAPTFRRRSKSSAAKARSALASGRRPHRGRSRRLRRSGVPRRRAPLRDDRLRRRTVKSADEETHFAVSASKEGKCERCWHYVAGIGSDAEHPTLCPRCASNLFGAGESAFA